MIDQLVIGEVTLPNIKGGRYSAYEDVLSTQLQMANGRMVEEIRGTVWVINYSNSSAIDNSTYQTLSPILRGRGGFQVTFLPDNGTDPVTSTFICTKRPTPKYMFDRDGEPVWADLSFTLREVEPHA